MRRRGLVVVVVVALMMIGLASPAASAPSPEGALKAGFNAHMSGGNGAAYASFEHGGMGGFNAAPNAIVFGEGATRIIPGFFDQTYCSTDVFGIWWFLIWEEKHLVAETDVEIFLDGEQLDLERSATKHVVNPNVWSDGVNYWWGSIGVPVLGTLELGDHSVSSHIVYPDGTVFDMAVTVTIVDC